MTAVDYRSVTATFDSLSPVAFILEQGKRNSNRGNDFSKDRNVSNRNVAAFGAVVCIAGTVALAKKERA